MKKHSIMCTLFLVSELAGVEVNGQVFRENGGTSCALSLVGFKKSRRMALKLLRQLILLEGKVMLLILDNSKFNCSN